MASLNKVSLIGRIGKKPEIRTMGNGKPVASFSLAVDQSYKKEGQKVEKTEWVNVVIFQEGLVKVVESYIDKGSLLYIEGALRTRKWDKNGVTMYSTEVVLQGFSGVLQMLDSKGSNEQSSAVQKPVKESEESTSSTEIDDDIPF